MESSLQSTKLISMQHYPIECLCFISVFVCVFFSLLIILYVAYFRCFSSISLCIPPFHFSLWPHANMTSRTTDRTSFRLQFMFILFLSLFFFLALTHTHWLFAITLYICVSFPDDEFIFLCCYYTHSTSNSKYACHFEIWFSYLFVFFRFFILIESQKESKRECDIFISPNVDVSI